jgi:lipoate-protein ligase A
MGQAGKVRLLRSCGLDPCEHLAVEECLLDQVEANPVSLFLWRSRDAVIIGKNQNPWRECRVAYLHGEGVDFTRRISGGGAVYHDEGNLNFSFVVRRDLYDMERQVWVVLNALGGLGIAAEYDGKSSIAVGGKKVSGNAFCFRKGSALHHGTLLVSTDLGRLRDCLLPGTAEIETRAINSVPSPVVNLAEVRSKLTVSEVEAALVGSFRAVYGEAREEAAAQATGNADISHLSEKYRSWEWCYGRTPPFDITFKPVLSGREAVVMLHVQRGAITAARIEINDVPAGLASRIAGELVGCRFESVALDNRIRQWAVREGSEIVAELADWFSAKTF